MLLSLPDSATLKAAAQATQLPTVAGSQHLTDPSIKDQFSLLTKLAGEAIDQDREFLGKVRFAIYPSDHSFAYDLDPVPTSVVLSSADPYGIPLEALVRVQSLRRDFSKSVAAEDFWISPLESIEKRIKECVEKLESSQSTPSSFAVAEKTCSSTVAEGFKTLDEAIQKYGRVHGFALVKSQTRQPIVGYRVHIKIEPQKAHVRVMTALEYKKYLYSHTPPDHYQWNELLDAETLMIGRYHYRADWPQELNGPDEGDFEIKNPGTITFTPKSK